MKYKDQQEHSIHLTMDTDWAPQFVVDYALDIIEEYEVKTTVFCTGEYDFSKRKGIEVALHPNFLPGSSQGKDEDEIMSGLKRTWPSAIGVRTHRMYWHNGLYRRFAESGMAYDSSLLQFYKPDIRPFSLQGVWRLPVWWVDFMHLQCGLGCSGFDEDKLFSDGLKVCIFHPTQVYLNTNCLEKYRKAMKELSPLEAAEEMSLISHRMRGNGIRDLFISFLNAVSRSGACTKFLGELYSTAE